jgi:hypothetical protein
MSGAITHRGEFVDALAALRHGGIIVRLDDDACLLDGVRLMWSFPELLQHGLVAEYANPQGFDGVRYYRMTRAGRDFADNAIAAWRSRPWLERMAIRLFG